MQLTLESNGPLKSAASVVAPPHSSFGGGFDDKIPEEAGFWKKINTLLFSFEVISEDTQARILLDLEGFGRKDFPSWY